MINTEYNTTEKEFIDRGVKYKVAVTKNSISDEALHNLARAIIVSERTHPNR